MEINPADIRLLRLLAIGGQALVYQALIPRVFKYRLVAVKIYTDAPGPTESFLREKSLLSKVDHPNVIKLLGWFSNDKERGLILEWMDGHTLQTLRRQSLLSAETCRHLFAQLLLVLAYLHDECHIVHGDLAPDNIFYNQGRVGLIDFGACLSPRDDLDHRGVFGKCRYLAPELLTGVRPNQWSDLYALGMIVSDLVKAAAFVPDQRLSCVLKACLAPSPFFRPRSAQLAYELLLGIDGD